MLNMFKTRKVATYKATVDMQIEEWADVMGCGSYIITVKRGQTIGLYQYGNGAFSHLQIGNSKVGKDGLFTPLESILSNCVIVQ